MFAKDFQAAELFDTYLSKKQINRFASDRVVKFR